MKKIFKKLILKLFFKYCRNEEWEIYKHNLPHLLKEIEANHIRNLLTRVQTKTLQDAILKSDREYTTVLDIISDAFTDNNYYEKTN